MSFRLRIAKLQGVKSNEKNGKSKKTDQTVEIPISKNSQDGSVFLRQSEINKSLSTSSLLTDENFIVIPNDNEVNNCDNRTSDQLYIVDTDNTTVENVVDEEYLNDKIDEKIKSSLFSVEEIQAKNLKDIEHLINLKINIFLV